MIQDQDNMGAFGGQNLPPAGYGRQANRMKI